MNTIRKIILLVGAGLSALVPPTVAQNSDHSGDTPPGGINRAGKLYGVDKVLEELDTKPMAHVIVTLSEPFSTPEPIDFNSANALRAWQRSVSSLRTSVLNDLSPGEVAADLKFDNIAGFSARITPAGLQALLAHPKVATVEAVQILKAHLAQGIPLMHAATYRATYNGAGVAIAICDTGVDYNHPRLGGGGFPNAKVIGGYDFGDNDPNPAPSAEAHGTACAGIAAGDLGTVGDYIGGVAPGAKIYALKIDANSSPGYATTAAMVAAWDWCVTHRNDNPNNPLLAISTSFGGGRYFANCDATTPAMTAAANNAVAAGITVLASSGNDGYCDSMGWPACISSVISVGAVHDANVGNTTPCVSGASCAPKIPTGQCTGWYVNDATAPDKVAAYSNTDDNLVLFAPAGKAYTLDIWGEALGGYNDNFSGTSAACPYAAGAVAALQSAAKARTGSFLTPANVKQTLTAFGDNITDTKVAITKPRVNLDRAIESIRPLVTVAATDATAGEPASGQGSGTFTFTRSGSTAAALTVNFTVGGTATAGSDYTSLGTSVIFAIGSLTTTKVVNVIDDALVESDETAVVTLAAGAGYTVGSPGSATVTLKDDDTRVTVTATDATAGESGTGLGTGAFTFTRTGSTTAALTVNYTVGGTAISGTDYASIGATATFAAGAATATRTVTVSDDSLAEPDETVVVTLAAGTGYAVGSPGSATVTIKSDDALLTVAATDATGGELTSGQGSGTFTFTRTGYLAPALTANFALTGSSATSGSDYTTLGTSVSFAAGAGTAIKTVSVLEDLLIEGDEQVVVTLAAGSGYSVGVAKSATVTIKDSQRDGPLVSWGVDAYSVVSGTPAGPFVSVAAGIGFTIATKPDGTLTAWGNNDHGQVSGVPAGTFTAVDTGDGHVLALRPDGTLVSWGDDSYGQVSGTPLGSFVAIAAGGDHSVGLRPDGTLVSWGRNIEGQVSGTPLGTFRAVSAGFIHSVGLRSDGTLVSWGANSYGQVSGTPAGSFAAVVAGGWHSVAVRLDGTLISWGYNDSGQVSGTPAGPFSLVAAGRRSSAAIKTDGTLVSWGNNTYGQVSGTPAGTFTAIAVGFGHSVAVGDDDGRITVAASDATAGEPGTGQGTGTFTFTRSGSTAPALTVNFTRSGTATSGSDFTAIGTTVTFAAGASTATKVVSVLDNKTIESDETVIVTLAPGAGYLIRSPNSATVRIKDDDARVTVAATDAVAGESGTGEGTATFTFTRSGYTASPLTVNFITGGTAISGTDYTSLGTTVSFTAGATTATKTLSVIEDGVAETDETCVLTLAAGSSYTAGSPGTATVSIKDDEPTGPVVTVTATDPTAGEPGTSDGTGTFTFTCTPPPTADLIVNFTVSGAAETSDYTPIGTTVTFAAGASTTSKTVTVQDDSLLEGDEPVLVTLAAGSGYSIGSPSQATVIIRDDEADCTLTALATAFAPGTLRNDVNGWRGHQFKVGASAIEVRQLGRIFLTGNSKSHVIRIVRVSDKAIIGSVTWTPSGGVNNQIKYVSLAAPIILLANTDYYLVSQEASGGDSLYSFNTALSTTTAATIVGAVYSTDGTTWSVPSSGTGSLSYGPVDLQYCSGSGVAPALALEEPTTETDSTQDSAASSLAVAPEAIIVDDVLTLYCFRASGQDQPSYIVEASVDGVEWISAESSTEEIVTKVDDQMEFIELRYRTPASQTNVRYLRLTSELE